MDELLSQLQHKINRTHPICVPSSADKETGSRLCHWSPLADALGSNDPKSGGEWWAILERLAAEDPGCGAAVGCMVGLALGDACGAPLEFCAVDSRLPDSPEGEFSDPRRPCLAEQLDEAGQLNYRNARNKFDLKLGQWTDDASMALCLADSLLVRGRYDGGDVRVRWHMWWFHGYCNAFRYDPERRKGRGSVGLGGNVAKSLQEIERSVQLAQSGGRLQKSTSHASVVPPVYQSTSNDSGNGSIMRLGPVPVAYHLVPSQALEVAGWQSLATHPGAEAALCCRFIASFCVAAIGQHRDAAKSSDAELTVVDPIGDPQAFLDNHIHTFLKSSESMALPKKLDQDGSCAKRLLQLLQSQAPSRKEAHWNWKVARLPIPDTISARQGVAGVDLYNGHPTIATYFGAYCMDGLAMALWALWNSNSYSSAVRKGVNLLGDADTVGAIVGQMAGALYGWQRIKSEEFSSRCVKNLKYWDKCAEIGLRAALLYHLGPRPRACLKPADGESKVKLYQRPSLATALAGELPSGEWVTCVDAAKDFYCASHESSGFQGWVSKKNIAEWAPAAGTEELPLFLCSGTEAPKSPSLPRREASPTPLIPKEPTPRPTLRDIKLPILVSARRP